MNNFQPTPFDMLTAIVVLAGVIRGRKRGMSNELMDMLEWVAIVVVGGFSYRPIGGLLIQHAHLPAVYAHLLGYVISTVVVLVVFRALKRGVGDKLVQGDIFGGLEFYLGMVAGAVRFSCMLLFVLAMVNAKYSTPADRALAAKAQAEALGSITFPTIPGVQQSIFVESASGKFIATNLNFLLIQPVSPVRGREGIGRARERSVNEINPGK